jgi:hypothetical protein
MKADQFPAAVPPGTSGTSFFSSSLNMSTRPVVDVPPQLTDPLISSRYAAAVDLNPNQLTTVGDTTSNLQWTVVRCDRPVLLWPIRSTVNAASSITGVRVGTKGTGYTIGQVLTLNTGTATTNATATVTAGSVATIGAFTNNGTGSQLGDTVTLGIAGAVGRAPTARVDNVAILTVSIVNGGTGYTNGAAVTAVGGTFTTAFSGNVTAAAGIVTAITISTFGNYTQLPSGTFTFTGGGGTGLTATANAQSAQSITLMNGGLLTAPATLPATATVTSSTGTGAIVNVTGYAVESVSLTNAGVFTTLPNNPSTVTSGAATLFQTGFTGAGTTQTFNSGSPRVIYYAPNRIPASTDYAQRSKGAGIVYLSNPGTWYLQHARDATSEAVTTEYVVVDAQDPAVIARYLAESGCHRVRSSQVSISSTGLNTALLSENRNRTALLIAPGDAALNNSRVQIAFGQTATGTNGLVIGTAVSANLYQSGETTWKGSVNASGLAGTYPLTVYVTEWE